MGSFRFDTKNTPIIEASLRFVSISLPLLRRWNKGGVIVTTAKSCFLYVLIFYELINFPWRKKNYKKTTCANAAYKCVCLKYFSDSRLCTGIFRLFPLNGLILIVKSHWEILDWKVCSYMYQRVGARQRRVLSTSTRSSWSAGRTGCCLERTRNRN